MTHLRLSGLGAGMASGIRIPSAYARNACCAPSLIDSPRRAHAAWNRAYSGGSINTCTAALPMRPGDGFLSFATMKVLLSQKHLSIDRA